MAEKAALTELIRDFKKTLEKKGNESDSSEDTIVHPSNRGRKLKRHARFVHEGQLDLPTGPKTYKEEIAYWNQKRYIISRKKRKRSEESDEENDSEETSGDEEDPYAEVDIAKILAPLTNPADLPTHPGLSHPYKSNVLEHLVKESRKILISQHDFTYSIKNLLTTFLGDDEFVDLEKMVEDFGQPPLDLGERIAEETGKIFNGWAPAVQSELSPESEQRTEGTGLGIMIPNGVTSNGTDGEGDSAMQGVQDADPHNDAMDTDAPQNGHGHPTPPPNSPPHRMTTRSANAPPASSATPLPELDPFFVPRKDIVDRTFGIPPIEAEETTRLLLAASQRQDEVLRGLNQIQELLLKADRMRKQVWSMARSMEGYRNHAAAKGLPVDGNHEDWGELTDGEDFFDMEEWRVDEPLGKGVEEEAEEELPGKKTRGRRNN